MNRPSRTEDDLEHPTWNQNPPFLAPDLTTCQDLNGIANAREQRNGGSGGSNAAFGCRNDDEKNCHIDNSDVDDNLLAHNSFAMSGPSLIACKTALGGEGQACRSQRPVHPPSGWIGWIASVVAVSTIVHCAGIFLPTLFSGAGGQTVVEPASTTLGGAKGELKEPPFHGRPPPFESTLLKRSIISKRESATCGSNNISSAEYNVPLHVGALVIILAVSGLACALPMIALKFPIVRIPERFFFAVRHFGTGVLLATAFVHLLPTAFISLGDPCLSSFWTSDYPAMPGAIALVGIFFVSIIEMVFSPARHFTPRRDRGGEKSALEHTHRVRSTSFGGQHCNQAQVIAAITRPSNARRGSAIEAAPVLSAGGNNSANASKESLGNGHVESQGMGLTEEQHHKKAILQCMLLEVGILFHSIFIGMALSVAVGGDFVVLLIAVAFHQTFEGLALGARIAAIKWPKKTMQPWFMVLAYGCTTPLGQAIGLATHQLYSPDSEFGLILVGTMNAISSGLLVFAALIELLAEDFLSDESWGVLRGRKRVAACFLVFFGAVCMSLVGAWA